MSQYAEISDLFELGLPAQAQGDLDNATLTAALISASNIVDTYFRGRYELPLVSWGPEVTEAVCRIAAYNIMSVRGYDPESGADENLRNRWQDSVRWLVLVQKQQAHPDVVPNMASSPQIMQPFVESFSVVGLASGRRARTRGW